MAISILRHIEQGAIIENSSNPCAVGEIPARGERAATGQALVGGSITQPHVLFNVACKIIGLYWLTTGFLSIIELVFELFLWMDSVDRIGYRQYSGLRSIAMMGLGCLMIMSSTAITKWTFSYDVQAPTQYYPDDPPATN